VFAKLNKDIKNANFNADSNLLEVANKFMRTKVIKEKVMEKWSF
jgi:hypothetical protein